MIKSDQLAVADHGLNAVQAVVRVLAMGASVDEALDLVAERVQTSLGATEVMILLVQGNRLLLRAGRGIEGIHLPRLAFADGTSIASWVAAHNGPLFVHDSARDPRFRTVQSRPDRIASVAAVPICAGDDVVGVLEVSADHAAAFAGNAALLTTMADVAGLVVEQARAARRARDDAAREFMREVRHDLRSPLTAVQGYAQLVQRRAAREGREADVRTAIIIVEQVQRMTAMLDALRDASADETGEQVEPAREASRPMTLSQRRP